MAVTQEINGKLYGVNESSGDFYDLKTGRPISRFNAYNTKTPAIPRNTFYDDEPSFITPRESNQFWTKRNPLTIAPPSPHQIRESANLAQIGAPGAMLAQLPEGAIKPFVRSPSPQSSIFSGGKYSNSPLNKIANLNINSPSNRENNMASLQPLQTQSERTAQYLNSLRGGRGFVDENLRNRGLFSQQYPVTGTSPNMYDERFKRFQLAEADQVLSDPESAGHDFAQRFANPGQNIFNQPGQYDAWGDAKKSTLFSTNLDEETGGTKPGTDYLGWANVGTGILKGLGSLASGYAAIKNLGLTRDAFEQQSAMGWKNLANQEAAYNQNIGSKKHFIEKTHADPTSPHLKYI